MLSRILGHFFGTWRFPAAALGFLAGLQAALVGILLVPAEAAALAGFAEDFKVWCLGYDPATGGYAGHAPVVVLEPAFLAALTVGLWWGPLHVARGARRAAAGWAVGGLALALASAGLLVLVGLRPPAAAVDPEAFPGASLRTAQRPPALRLVSHTGAPLALEDLRGQVVVVTAVYAKCNLTCPMIMAQTRGLLEKLGPAAGEGLTVVGITLDPERDDPAVMARMAEGQGLRAPAVHLCSGAPEVVNRTLDAWGFARRRDPETGIIDHVNLFVVVDRAGRVAYRFGLGERQERWLVEAVRGLLAEPQAAP